MTAEKAPEDIPEKSKNCLAEAFDSVHIQNAKVEITLSSGGAEIFHKQVIDPEGAFLVVSFYGKAEGPDNKVSFTVWYDGTKPETMGDVRDASLSLAFEKGKITERTATAHPDYMAGSTTSDKNIIVDFTEAIEHHYVRCMDMSHSDERPSSAAKLAPSLDIHQK